jgi:hypothetical protein
MSCIHSEMKPPGMNGSSVMCMLFLLPFLYIFCYCFNNKAGE